MEIAANRVVLGVLSQQRQRVFTRKPTPKTPTRGTLLRRLDERRAKADRSTCVATDQAERVPQKRWQARVNASRRR